MSLVLRNLIFVVLQPGVVAGLVPYLIVRDGFWDGLANGLLFHHYIGVVIFLVGFCLLLHCVRRFVLEGLGTISPADPTKRLVVSGLYRYSRNPMYVGVMAMLLGEVVFSQSAGLLVYAMLVFVMFYLFIVYREEPRLARDFGNEYEAYRKNVRRWL